MTQQKRRLKKLNQSIKRKLVQYIKAIKSIMYILSTKDDEKREIFKGLINKMTKIQATQGLHSIIGKIIEIVQPRLDDVINENDPVEDKIRLIAEQISDVNWTQMEKWYIWEDI